MLDDPLRIKIGESWRDTFRKAVVYEHICNVHRKYDMKGVVIVKDS